MPHKLSMRVVHVSGQDDSYKASELNQHSPLTKGWQAARFCLYPQDLVMQLHRRSRLRKIQILSHQFLIATKIEFYVGDVPDNTAPSLQNARYTRLGYVSLSDNEKTGYKARELKSVHVDAVGLFLKLVIHKNHINNTNLYNQVGIIAVNVIGDMVPKTSDPTDPDYYYYEDQKQDDPAATYNRPDYISPLDDLAFDMYQDPEVANIIRQLEKKKQEAVLQERYDFAKKLKLVISELQKAGEKLGKLEVEKKQSVENEDYDRAKLKKVQMDEYRLQIYNELQIDDLLEKAGIEHLNLRPIDLEPVRLPTPPRLPDLDHPTSPHHEHMPLTPYEDRPLPALKAKEPPPTSRVSPTPTPAPPPLDDLPIHTLANRPSPRDDYPQDDREPDTGDVPDESSTMSEQDLREASFAIDVFELPLVSKAYSKSWSSREMALQAVHSHMEGMTNLVTKDEAKTTMRAAIFLAQRAIDDKVFAVYKASLNLLKMILTSYAAKHKIPRSDLMFAVEKTLVPLLHKSGDTALRNRELAKDFIGEMSSFPEIKPTHVVPHECIKPFKLTIAPRLGISRMEVVEQLYKTHGLSDSGLTVDNLMKFCLHALQHTDGKVREVSERIIKILYKDIGQPIKDYLPPDDEKTRKNVLYRQLFEHFDEVDGKPSKKELKKQAAQTESKKQAEIDALHNQLQQLKDMAAGKVPVDENALKSEKPPQVQPKKPTADKKPKAKVKPKPPPVSAVPPPPPQEATDDTASVFNIDRTCIFCNEKNEDFTEEGLDLHYWKACPMLKRCSNCKQVVEVAGYTDHVLSECEAGVKFTKCPRCTEAINANDYEQHVNSKTCNPARAQFGHCPLCHDNIENSEESWKGHLMGTEGCKHNPRRLLALNKHATSGKQYHATTEPRNKENKSAKSSIPRSTKKPGKS